MFSHDVADERLVLYRRERQNSDNNCDSFQLPRTSQTADSLSSGSKVEHHCFGQRWCCRYQDSCLRTFGRTIVAVATYTHPLPLPFPATPREGDLLRSTHISLWEHSSHERLIGRGVPGCVLFLAGAQLSVWPPPGKTPRSPYERPGVDTPIAYPCFITAASRESSSHSDGLCRAPLCGALQSLSASSGSSSRLLRFLAQASESESSYSSRVRRFLESPLLLPLSLALESLPPLSSLRSTSASTHQGGCRVHCHATPSKLLLAPEM